MDMQVQSHLQTVVDFFDLGRNESGEPYAPAPHQVECLEAYGDELAAGVYDAPGCGKTLAATLHALYWFASGRTKRAIVVCPSQVVSMWARFLSGIRVRASGNPLQVLAYQGTPAQRKAFKIMNYHVIVMGFEIMKRDFSRLTTSLAANPQIARPLVIVDEAHHMKNVSTRNFRSLYLWFKAGCGMRLLTGTPATGSPEDLYAYMRITNPEAYRNKTQLYNEHVAGFDAYDKPNKWKALNILRSNFMHNATAVKLEDVADTLPKVSIETWGYDLAPAHRALYRKLMEEQVLAVPGTGEQITALQAGTLWHKAQQLVCNFGHFTGTSQPSACLELVQEWLEELGDAKLVVSAMYRMTNEALLKSLAPYNPRLIYGGYTRGQRAEALEAFTSDPSVRVLLLQSSIAEGLDGLQRVCNNFLFLEVPQVPSRFRQAYGRLQRIGQTKPVRVRLAMAAGTIQVRSVSRLLTNDEVLGPLTRTRSSLRNMIFGR